MNTVLIADDDPDMVELLSRRCQELGAAIVCAYDAQTALDLVNEKFPDLAILDVDMPGGSGMCVCESIMNSGQWSSLPVIVLTGRTDEATVRRCHSSCAYYVSKCPDVWSRVEPLVKELLDLADKDSDDVNEPNAPQCTSVLDTVFALLGMEDADGVSFGEDSLHLPPMDMHQKEIRDEQAWVLSIEDDEDFALAMQMRLEQHGVRVVRATAGTDGYRKAFLNKPQAIILDYELPEGNGDYVLTRLKESSATRDIPVIMLTGRREGYIERQIRNLGATEFLTKPVDWTRLWNAISLELV
jgi:DNA-binding response OmpR family regulator